jgi:phosphate/sulfate permease
MSNIISDIVEDINLKPNKSKLVLKWVIRCSIGLICAAFIIGQVKSSHINKLDKIQNSIDDNTAAINNLNQQMITGFNNANLRIDKIYDDGFNMFNDFQIYNKKQLEIIIEYGQTNKELVMKMLDVN